MVSDFNLKPINRDPGRGKYKKMFQGPRGGATTGKDFKVYIGSCQCDLLES
jgi:hypothetical protein